MMKKMILMPVKIFIFSIVTLVFLIDMFIVSTAKNIDWQILLYLLIFFIFIIALWITGFVKIHWGKRIYWLLLFIFLYSARLLPSVEYQHDLDACIDIGYCKEGLKIYGGIMSEEFCLENNDLWNEEDKLCDTRSELRACRDKGCKWIYNKSKCSCEDNTKDIDKQ